jgi:DNA-binding SARP family transcriptional activator
MAEEQAMNDALLRQAFRDIQPSALELDSPQALCSGSGVIVPLHVKLLGGFCVERTDVGHAVSDWPRRRAKTLIKLLAVQPGHALHREQIIDVLWSGADAESALNSFGKALHAARRSLEPGLPRRQDSAYLRLVNAVLSLNTEHVAVDLDRFEQLAEDAIRRREFTAYEAALAAYGGELLPEDRYESWCSDRRGVLAELHVRLLLGMAEILERRGAYNEAADRLRDALHQDPTREAVHRQLMLLYARMGTPDQAVRQFHICEAVLRRELDLAPQPETISLCNQILTNRLPLQPSKPDRIPLRAEVRHSAPAQADRRPFVGRERVIQRMCDQLTRCDVARAGMIVVSGETGVGKTRLLEEFAVQAKAQGAITLCGGRGAHANQFACGPFAVALEDYAEGLSEAERAELARAYPALASFVPSLGAAIPLPAPASDLRDYRLGLFPSIVQFLMDLARTKPVLLVLGDLQEADPVGLDLIRYLAHLAVRSPLVMVGALRDPDIESGAELQRMIEAMTRERLWLRIDLHCLSRRATDELVGAMLPGACVKDDMLAEIYAQSRGNPLFILDLVDGLTSADDPAHAYEGSQGFPWFSARLHTRTRALTAMRLALMDEPLRRMLGLAATVGAAGIPLGQLCAGAAALEPSVAVPVLFDALDRALRMRLLEERDEGYAFRHPIVRSALYDCLPRHRRDEFRAALARSDAEAHARSTAYLAGGSDIREVSQPSGDRPSLDAPPCCGVVAVGTAHLPDGLDRFERAMARLFREVRVRGWSGPSTRSRAATVRASSGIASAVLPAST